jgi:D-alanyl-D-alanine carboxypeptidase
LVDEDRLDGRQVGAEIQRPIRPPVDRRHFLIVPHDFLEQRAAYALQRAALELTDDLRRLGVRIRGRPSVGRVPANARVDATVGSAPLVGILRRQNVSSLNLDAEVLVKALGASVAGEPGTIENGAAAIEAWAAHHGVTIRANDGSGLSYADRITTDGMVQLLGTADRSSWGSALRSTLPAAGEGTLADRLAGLSVRAKTGTLVQGVSALSGWVRSSRSRRWLEFSILSAGLSKTQAVTLEDRIANLALAGVTILIWNGVRPEPGFETAAGSIRAKGAPTATRYA